MSCSVRATCSSCWRDATLEIKIRSALKGACLASSWTCGCSLLMGSFHVHLFLKDHCPLPFQILVLGGKAPVSKHFWVLEENSFPRRKPVGSLLASKLWGWGIQTLSLSPRMSSGRKCPETHGLFRGLHSVYPTINLITISIVVVLF